MLLSSHVSPLHRPWVSKTYRFLTNLAHKRRPTKNVPTKPSRTRFAPSPTGYLHLGSLRTALFNYLLAKSTGGQFILRIEDTDKVSIPTVDDAELRIIQDLKWAGLRWDEGPDVGGPYGPYRQSERASIYREHAEKLLKSKNAYRCFCSAERLRGLARQRNQLGLPTDYDRNCDKLSKTEVEKRVSNGEPYVIRLKVGKTPVFQDLVYGTVGNPSQNQMSCNSGEMGFEDPILLKSDGLPTYHLANVVDDHYMEITHVIRATEWMSSTPKHLFMYKAFGWYSPQYAHVGLLQNKNREKFSKRNEDFDIRSFEKDGIFSEALLNYAALFGWSHNRRSDVLSLQDLIQNFTLKFTKGNTIVEPTKLYYLQKKYSQKYVEENSKHFDDMVQRVCSIAEDGLKLHLESINSKGTEVKSRVEALLRLDAKNYTTPQAFFDRHACCFRPVSRGPFVSISTDEEKTFTINHIRIVIHHIDQIPSETWSETEIYNAIGKAVQDIIEMNSMRLEPEMESIEKKKFGGAISHYLRWAITGGNPGPGIPAIAEILGKNMVLQRLKEASDEFITSKH